MLGQHPVHSKHWKPSDSSHSTKFILISHLPPTITPLTKPGKCCWNNDLFPQSRDCNYPGTWSKAQTSEHYSDLFEIINKNVPIVLDKFIFVGELSDHTHRGKQKSSKLPPGTCNSRNACTKRIRPKSVYTKSCHHLDPSTPSCSHRAFLVIFLSISLKVVIQNTDTWWQYSLNIWLQKRMCIRTEILIWHRWLYI